MTSLVVNGVTSRAELYHTMAMKSMGTALDTITINGSVRSRPASADRRHYHVKVFKARETITNQLIASDHNFQAIYDAFLVQLVLLLVYSFASNSYHAGRLYLDLSIVWSGKESLSDALSLVGYELFLLAYGLATQPALKLWSSLRHFSPCAIDMIFLTLYLSSVLASIGSTILFRMRMNIDFFFGFVISAEQVRIVMKSYSFVRENVCKVLRPWGKDDREGPASWYEGQMSPRVGSFRQHLYFMFSPTMLYRDYYPRVAGPIRWRAVLLYLSQFLVALWGSVFIFQHILLPESFKYEHLLESVMLSFVMAFLMMLLIHTTVLHAWGNMWAEIVRFADKEFYSNWWACTSYSSYYRKWNLVVHDWIHSYIYQDMKTLVGKRFAFIPTLLMSSLVHEYCICLAVGFFLPILTILFFGLGGLFYMMKPVGTHRLSNLAIIASLSVGFGIFMSVILLEFAARTYCPLDEVPSLTRIWVPRMAHCYVQFNS